MTSFQVLLLLVLTESIRSKSEMIGVEKVSQSKYPWVGYFRFLKAFDGPNCVVNLVSKDYAVTAGHCLVHDTTAVPLQLMDFEDHPAVVIVGTKSYKDLSRSVQIRNVDRGFIHSRANFSVGSPFGHRYDVGSLRLDTPFELTQNVQVIHLVPHNLAPRAIDNIRSEGGGDCRVPRWSRGSCYPEQKAPHQSHYLEHENFDLVGNRHCCSYFQNKKNYSLVECLRYFILTSGYSCLHQYMGNFSACTGYAGSPVVCEFEGDSYVFGMHVGNFPTSSIASPGIYLRYDILHHYVQGILNKDTRKRSGGNRLILVNYIFIICSIIDMST